MNGSEIKANIVLFGYKIACKSGNIESNGPNTHAAEANQTGALMTGKWVHTASMLWVWPAGLREVQQWGMNAHQGGPKCCKSIGMFRPRGKQDNIVFLKPCKGLFDSRKLFPLADSVLNMMSAWQSAPCQQISKTQKEFFSSYFNHSSASWLVLCSQMPKSREEKSSYAPPPPSHHETTQ